MKKFSLLVLLMAVSLASAAVIEDFEDGTYAGPGTVIVDPDNAANHVLFLNLGEVFTMATPGAAGIVGMDIYDFGDSIAAGGTIYGPRWGVAGSGEVDPNSGSTINASVGAQIIYKSYLNGNNGYGCGSETIGTGSWWSPSFFAGPRQVDALDDPETTEVNEADGAWTTWEFMVGSDGSAAIKTDFAFSDAFYNGPMTLVDMNQIRVSGGRTSVALPSGVLVDNISFAVPEPATMSMLALGGLALLRRRK